MTTFSTDHHQFSKKLQSRTQYCVCHIYVNQSAKRPVGSPTTSSQAGINRRQLVVEHVVSRKAQSDQPSSSNIPETDRKAPEGGGRRL
jgi:hypothetical protein